MTLSSDVVIVGASLAGATLATLLARAGWRVALVDASQFPRQKVCGEFLGSAALPVLETLGLAAEVRRQAVPVRRVSLVLPNERALTASAAISTKTDSSTAATVESGYAVDSPLALSRFTLDALLVEQATHAGSTVHLGMTARELHYDSAGAWRVLLAGSNATGAGVSNEGFSSTGNHSASLELTAPLLVAADGRRSFVVRQTGRLVQRGPSLIGFKRHCPPNDTNPNDDAHRNDDTLRMYTLPGGYVGVAPVEGRATNVCGVIPRRVLADNQGSFDSRISDWLGMHPSLRRLLAPSEPARWLTIPDVSTQRARPCVAGVLYIGDAAGTIEPLTGQGMTMALIGALLAYRRLSQLGAGRLFDRPAQRAYDTEWDATFGLAVRRASLIAALLRRPALLSAVARVDRLRDRLAERIFQAVYRSIPFDPADYRELAATANQQVP